MTDSYGTYDGRKPEPPYNVAVISERIVKQRDSREQAVFLLAHLLGYEHRPEFVNEYNASYRSDVELLAAELTSARKSTPEESA